MYNDRAHTLRRVKTAVAGTTAGVLTVVALLALWFCLTINSVKIKPLEVDAPAELMKKPSEAEKWDLRGHLSSMTPYKYAKTGARDMYVPPVGCELVSVDLVARHGSRFPTLRTTGRIKSLEAFVRSHNATLTMPWMRNWTSPFFVQDEGKLSPMGIQEHRNLGKHFSRMFPSILRHCNLTKAHYTSTFVTNLLPTHTHIKYIYTHTHTNNPQKPRTGHSGTSFGEGAGCGSNVVPKAPNVGEEDRLLRFFDACPKYVAKVKNTAWARAEAEKYFALHTEEIARRIGRKIGVAPKVLDSETIRTMWLACRAEVATFDKSDGWCTVFSQRDVRLLEFRDDMEAFYIKGHGHPLSNLCAQPLLADIAKHMDVVAGRNGSPPGYFRFAHAETLLPLMALLGFYNESTPPTAMWGDAEVTNRKWRTAEVAPLAGNVAFVQYKCGGNRFVELMHNEVVKAIPGCDGSERLCPIKRFKEIFRNILGMDWNAACRNTEDRN